MPYSYYICLLLTVSSATYTKDSAAKHSMIDNWRYLFPNHSEIHHTYVTPYGKYEEPPYTIMYPDPPLPFEERVYMSGYRFVCTKENFFEHEWFTYYHRMVWRIFRYLSGDNKQGIRLPMTVPINARISNINTVNFRLEMTVCQYIYQFFDIPDPNDPRLEIRALTDKMYLEVYTRKVGGTMSWKRWNEELFSLMALVMSHNRTFDIYQFYLNVYNPPTVVTNRRNEIWLLKSDREY